MRFDPRRRSYLPLRAGAAAAIVGAGLLVAQSATVIAHDVEGRPGGATYYRDVLPLLQQHCQTCHREGGSAPFSLSTYADARARSGPIVTSTKYGTMPPVPVRLGAHEFVGPRRLLPSEAAVFEDWLSDGLQEGDPADAPTPVVESESEWKLGEPDVVLANAPRGFVVPANPTPDRHQDRFQCFYVPTGFDADRWVTGIEIRPGSGAVVHHVLLFLDVDRQSRVLDRRSKGPGYENYSGVGFPAPVILSWNPGAPPVRFAEGVGFKIPRGAAIAMQIHYAYASEPVRDVTLVGLHFARAPVVRERFVIQPKNEDFTIPANARGTQIDAWMTLNEDLTADSITPHQHRLGYEIAVDAIRPGVVIDELIHVDWDVFRQGTFVFKDPVSLPAGTVLHVWGLYDNTSANPLNPNSPPADVHWGRESFNEMLFSFLGVTRDAQTLTAPSPEMTSASVERGRLVVEGTGFSRGVAIEVDGRLALDTRVVDGGRRVVSARSWRRLVRGGESMSVRVLNPDGRGSHELSMHSHQVAERR